jgi:hypothetical protein
MKSVIFCYSRFGNGRMVAEALARELSAELRQVWSRPRSYLMMGLQALFKSCPKIDPIDTNLAGFDLVVLGFPLWMGRPGAPMRTLLRQLDLKDRNIAYWVMTRSRRGDLGNLTPDFEAELRARGARVRGSAGLGSASRAETDEAAFAQRFAQKLMKTFIS